MIDDESPLIQPLKKAFYDRAYPIAARLQTEVDAGRMTSAEADRKLVEEMQQPEMLQAIQKDSMADLVAH
jgi:hypothetical protein